MGGYHSALNIRTYVRYNEYATRRTWVVDRCVLINNKFVLYGFTSSCNGYRPNKANCGIIVMGVAHLLVTVDKYLKYLKNS